MGARRAFLVALIGGALLSALFAIWFVSGWGNAKARAAAIGESAEARGFEESLKLAEDLEAALEGIRSGEDARPYYEYQNLFHDPRGASVGPSVNPSPLATKNADPLVSAHFQIAPDGKLTMPQLNEELPELSNQFAVSGNQKVLATLRAAKAELGGERVQEAPKVAVRTPRRRRTRPKPIPPKVRLTEPPTDGPGPQQQLQRIDPEVFAQNADPNLVFQQVQGQATAPPQKPKSKPKPRRRSVKRPKAAPVEIRIGSFEWRVAMLGDDPTIAATRLVESPTGTLAQGFVIDTAAVKEWLSARSDRPVELVTPLFSETLLSKVAIGAPGLGDWAVYVDVAKEREAAEREAARVRQRFWLWFSVAGGLGVVALVLLVWIVHRAERLARVRSQFAAAAAHELRTPLAGLQLYGEMLADGLGDLSQQHNYARRISDEAARLGRVVNNVLGFTQLERGSLAVNPTPGDAVAATRRAVDRSRSSLEEAGMVVVLEAPERLPALIDEDAYARILANLLDNAEKYSRGHRAREVRITVSGADEHAVVTVMDSGSGVSARARRRIFKPFTRDVDGDGAAGLGLGLALARTLARDQGGDLVCLSSDDAEGACFELRLKRL